jgi:Tfp pilus assembly protein PilX
MPAGIIMAVVIGLLVVGAIVAALVSTKRSPHTLPLTNLVKSAESATATRRSTALDTTTTTDEKVDTDVKGPTGRVATWQRACSTLLATRSGLVQTPLTSNTPTVLGKAARDWPSDSHTTPAAATAIASSVTNGGHDGREATQVNVMERRVSLGPSIVSDDDGSSEYFRAKDVPPLDWVMTAEADSENNSPQIRTPSSDPHLNGIDLFPIAEVLEFADSRGGDGEKEDGDPHCDTSHRERLMKKVSQV